MRKFHARTVAVTTGDPARWGQSNEPGGLICLDHVLESDVIIAEFSTNELELGETCWRCQTLLGGAYRDGHLQYHGMFSPAQPLLHFAPLTLWEHRVVGSFISGEMTINPLMWPTPYDLARFVLNAWIMHALATGELEFSTTGKLHLHTPPSNARTCLDCRN